MHPFSQGSGPAVAKDVLILEARKDIYEIERAKEHCSEAMNVVDALRSR